MTSYNEQQTVQLRLPQAPPVRGRHRRPGLMRPHDTQTLVGLQPHTVARGADADSAETNAPPTLTMRQAFSRFWPLTRGDRRWLVLICVGVIVAALCETAAILLFGELTDHALQKGSLSAFWAPAGQWLAVAVLGAAVGYAGNSLAVWTAERFVMRLRAHVFGHVQDLPPDFFQRHRQGDLLERLTGDVESIEEMVVSGVVGIVSAVFNVVLFSAAALWLRWDLALATFLLAPVLWLTARKFSAPIKSVAREERVADGAITSVVEEALGNVVLTQAYNRKNAEEKRLRREARAWMRASVTGARMSELYEQAVEVLETVCVLGVIGLGAWEISQDRMTLGQLLSFAAFLGYLYPPLRSLGQLGLTISAATAGAERLLDILDTRPAVTDPPAHQAVTPWRVHGTVQLDRVGFSYPGQDAPTLSNVSLTARPGEFIVVTGPSGAGKSTIAKLLLRFYDPTAGSIHLDGVDLNTVALSFLRENVTLLPQKTLILHDTIHENIACGRPGATAREVEHAARAAAAHDFVTALPDGYDTHIDPHSAQLSGGQLQRIAIARAMLRDAPVLILDEPTTGLDALAARRVIGPLRQLMSGRTTIMITHDLQLAPQADRIVVLNDGQVVETGTHHELLTRRGVYAELHGVPNGVRLKKTEPAEAHFNEST